MITSLLVGTYLLTMSIAFVGKTDFSLTYTRIAGIDSIALLIMILITGLIFIKFNNKKHYNNTLLIGIFVNTLLTIITTFILPGASFIFMLPALVGIISYIVKDLKINLVVKQGTLIFSYVLMMLLMLPILFSFYMALTIGGLTILVLLLFLNSLVTIPLISHHLDLIK